MKQISKNKKIILLILGLFIILGFLFASGIKGAERLEVDWPTAPGGKELTITSTLVDFVEYSYRWGILLGGLAAFFALIIAGFQYLTSVGDPNKMKEARNRIIAAILGLVLLLSTFLILNTLNPELTTLTAPTTTVPGLEIGSWLAPDLSKPCEETILYEYSNYDETEGFWTFEAPHDLPPPEGTVACHNWKFEFCPLGPIPWLNCPFGLGLISWGSEQINSIKIKGACQVNLYDGAGCSGSFVGIGRSQADLSWMDLEHVSSVEFIDIRPPGPPIVENYPTPFNVGMVGTTCQAELGGTVIYMNKNDVIMGFVDYGKNHGYCKEESCFNVVIPKNSEDRDPLYGDGEVFEYLATELSTTSSYYWRAATLGAGFGLAPVATFSLNAACNLTSFWYE